MEIAAFIREQFAIEPVDLRTYSPLTLAYIGDGVFDLVIRTVVVERGNTKASRLHNQTSQIVRAGTQAKMIELLEPYLTAEEKEVYRRGRNAKSPTMAKNASMSDYRSATGFEALIGFLYLKDDFARVVELTKKALEELEMDR